LWNKKGAMLCGEWVEARKSIIMHISNAHLNVKNGRGGMAWAKGHFLICFNFRNFNNEIE
jgi:hypothetical protein